MKPINVCRSAGVLRTGQERCFLGGRKEYGFCSLFTLWSVVDHLYSTAGLSEPSALLTFRVIFGGGGVLLLVRFVVAFCLLVCLILDGLYPSVV